MINERIELLVERVADRIAPARMDYDALDLNAIATSLGAVKVVYRFARVHGFTEWTRWGPVIVTSMARTDGRRRSTLAHECAHLLFDPIITPAGLNRWGQDNVDAFRRRSECILDDDLRSTVSAAVSEGIESLCDRLSFEMLFPRRRASRFVGSALGLDEVREISDSSRVSLAVSVTALNRFDANLSLLRLARTTDGTWIVADAVSPRSSWRLGQALTAECARRLEILEPGARCAESIPLSFESRTYPVSADVRRSAAAAVVLITERNTQPDNAEPCVMAGRSFSVDDSTQPAADARPTAPVQNTIEKAL